MDEIVHEFLVESYENLDQLDRDLVALEGQPDSRELLSSIFRTVHTIKGTSGFLGYGTLERVAHVGEGLLSDLRDGARPMDRRTTDALLRLVDTLRASLGSIEAGGGDAVEMAGTLAAIEAIRADDAPPARPAPARRVIGARRLSRPDPACVSAGERTADPPVAGERTADPPARSAAESSVRVDVGLLDTLMRQVGELVLVRNQIDRIAEVSDAGDLARSAQRLSLVAGELQEGVMKTRLQPIEHVWSTMPRVVRDLSATLGRTVALTLLGGETELDRSLLEAVKDPLTHLVRNAVDHGIEDPDERRAMGKPEEGHVTLRAYHAGGQVVVEIVDDGRGIDADAIATAAIAQGLLPAERIRAMAAQEIYELLFLPGFSTAKEITNVSGRGVGMDVVRTKIEAVGGSVDVESRPGLGTTWRLRIPLTLAIMPALTVRCGVGTYAVAQANLLELVAVDPAQVEYVGTAPVYRLRGALLPLVSLREVLGTDGAPPASWVIVVLEADDHRFGLLVDRVLNNEEIVVKGLSARIKQLGVYSGATVLGDGAVALILDVQAIARRAFDGQAAAVAGPGAAARTPEAAAGEQLLVVGIGRGRRVAVPLSAVTRLERMPADRVERVGSREVLQYRGALLPLARLDRILGVASVEQLGELTLVVLAWEGVSVGMVVTEIVDIVTEDPGRRSDLQDPGLTGSTVIEDRVTELLDVAALLRSVRLGLVAVPDHDGLVSLA